MMSTVTFPLKQIEHKICLAKKLTESTPTRALFLDTGSPPEMKNERLI